MGGQITLRERVGSPMREQQKPELAHLFQGPVNTVSIMELRDGKVARETHYFADPFEPPEWRARWVERM